MASALLLDSLYAAGIALSPTPVVVVILILFSTTKRRIALAYLIGWIIGLLLLGIIILVLTKTSLDFLESRTRVAHPLADLVIGFLLVGFGLFEWRRRPQGTAKPPAPRMIKRMDELLSSSDVLTPFRALGLAIVMSVASPKNIALMIAAGLAIRRAGVAVSDMALLLVVFVLIASITVGIPVIYAIVEGERAAEQLTRSKAWLLENNARVVAVMLFVIGLFLIVKATGELTGIG